MAKKEIDVQVQTIKKLHEEGKLVIGTQKTLTELKHGRIATVFIAGNCSEEVEKDIRHYAELAEAEVIKLGYLNTEIGTMVKKPFSIQVLGEKKQQ